MEADGEDLENIFEEYENEDEAENTENKTANETPGAVKIAAPKRVVKNPRLKFNADRLCGERGIPVLVDHFKLVKFKGAGHEVEDLDKLLTKLEHWTHRLFPSMKFEDCLTHIEKLGKKRQVQTCLRKIRLDMPILNGDFEKDDDDDDDDVRRNEDFEPEEINAFDRLLGESREISSSNANASTSENVSNSSSFYSSPMPDNFVGHVLGSSFGSSLNDEQKERMERNRMLAAERRKARLAAMEQNTLRSESENHETVSENAHSNQNSFNKLLDSSESNIERNKSGLETSYDFDESFKKSSDLRYDNSEELGLDDLMNLVDEEDPVSDGNAIVSPSEKIESVSNNVNEVNTFPSEDAENFKNFDNVSKNTKNKIISSSENSPEKNLNIESSLDLICKTSVNSKINANTDYFVNGAPINDENVIMKNGDFNSVACEDENSYPHVSNIKQTNKFLPDNAENFKNFDNVSESAKSKVLLSPKSSKKSPEENLNMESSLDLICENSVDSEVSAEPSCSLKGASVIDEHVIRENENLSSMDCDDQDS